MFLTKQTPPSPPPAPPTPDGLEFRLKLSEDTLAKLLPWAISVIVGSSVVGVVHAQRSPSAPHNPALPVEQTVINEQSRR